MPRLTWRVSLVSLEESRRKKKGKKGHLRGELKAFVAFWRSSSQHPSLFSRGRRILPLASQCPPCSFSFSLSFGASSRRARGRGSRHLQSSVSSRVHRESISRNRCLTPPLPHHPQVVNTRTNAFLTHTRTWSGSFFEGAYAVRAARFPASFFYAATFFSIWKGEWTKLKKKKRALLNFSLFFFLFLLPVCRWILLMFFFLFFYEKKFLGRDRETC